MQREALSELEQKATNARQQVYSALKLRSPGRYEKLIFSMEHSTIIFLFHFRSLRKAALSAKVFTNAYAGLRGIDDVVDGDARLPAHNDSSQSYISDRINFF